MSYAFFRDSSQKHLCIVKLVTGAGVSLVSASVEISLPHSLSLTHTPSDTYYVRLLIILIRLHCGMIVSIVLHVGGKKCLWMCQWVRVILGQTASNTPLPAQTRATG